MKQGQSALERFACKNPYDALALLDLVSMHDAYDLAQYERVVTGHESVIFPSTARHILASEHARSRTNGNVRLNATLPDCPDFDVPIESAKDAKSRPAANFSEGEPQTGQTKKPEKPKNKDRLKIVLARVKARIESASNVNLSLFAWALLSSATLPWKMMVFDEIHPAGLWTLNDYDLSRMDFLGMVCYLAEKRGARHEVVKRIGSRFSAAAMEGPLQYVFSPGTAEEVGLVTDPASYSVYSSDPLWSLNPADDEVYVRWLKSVINCNCAEG